MHHHDDGPAPGSDDLTSDAASPAAEAAAASEVPAAGRNELRLVGALKTARSARLPDPDRAEDALGWLDVAVEAALGDDGARAAAAARAGLDAPGSDAPDCALALWRAAAVAADITQDADELSTALEARSALLRRLGRPVQARVELQLGAALLHEPDSFEATVLAGVVEDERARLRGAGATADTVLPEALTALAVARTQDGDHAGALQLVDEAIAHMRRIKVAGDVLPWGSLASAQLLRGRLCLWTSDPDGAQDAACDVLARPCGRAVRASALLVRALACHALQRLDDAADWGIAALELMQRAGLRRGAASAAALVARALGASAAPSRAALLAWEIAAVNAERAESPDAATLTYWWGHQLIMHGRAEEAVDVLDPVVRRARTTGTAADEARALVDLGHAHHELDRTDSALEAWGRAADLFEDCGRADDAARTLLAAGALLNRQDEAQRPRAQALFERAVQLARQVREEDPTVLPIALHSLGYVTCELGDPSGLTMLDEALALVRESAARWQEADYLDTRARSLWALRRGDEAVSTALQAADLFVDADDPGGARQAELFAAFVAAEDGAPDTGVTLFSLLADDAQAPHLVRLAALTGLEQCHVRLGDETSAARVHARLLQLQQEADAPAGHRAAGNRAAGNRAAEDDVP
ncbi:hypothetical protein FM125_07315 [Micrococcus lylae]|uniref:Tetratricopeptide repeat protein n=1 Tax=Micrococcus lylae TaxID=1273 RepID=A0A1R4J9J0_9MICC|nr:hypothetical protein [Micrococcus lylae]SJN28790.1 hypothetical protein FM125_07315 [Micrococcus lylae]